MSNKRTVRRMSLFGINFYAGLGTMAFEMVLARALTPFFGGTIYTWGALIAVFLVGMSFGFFFGGRLADRFPRVAGIGIALSACSLLILATPLVAEPLCLALLDAIEDTRYGALVASVVLAFIPAMLFASVSPVAVRLVLVDVARSGSTVGLMSALNTLGSIIGTIGTSFLLVPLMGSKAIFVALGVLTLLLGVTLIASDRQRRRPTAAAAAAAVIGACAMATMLGTPAPAIAQPAKSAAAKPSVMAPDGVIESVESEYNNVYVIKRGRYLYMNFGYRGSQYVESVFDSLDPTALTVEYTRYMTLATLYAGKVERGAFVGLGGGRTASYLVNSLPGFKLEIAELDPEVIRLAKTYFGLQESERMKVFPQDGRIFLNRAKGTYDIIFLDAYRGPFVPFHLLTKEYFELAKKRLSPRGVVAQNVEPSTMVLDSAIMTIGSVFKNVETFDAGGNVVIIAYDGDRVPESVLQQRAQALTAAHKLRYPLTDLLKARKTITPEKGAKLLTDDFAPVEMLKTIKRHNERRK